MRGKLGIILLIAFFASPLSAQELTGTLQQIKKSGQITIDICKGIVTEVENKIGTDVNIDYIPVTADGRFKALGDNKIDILCGSTTKTLSRSELVDFTQLTKDNKTLDSAGFDGTKIGVVKATTTAVALKKLIQETSTNAEVVLFNSAKESIEALRQKKIDAFSSDQIVLIGLALKEHDPMSFVVRSDVFSFEPFALAVRRNDADFRLVADRVISELYRSRKILEIYDKWIGKFTRKRLPIFDAMVKLNATPE
jgi:ABC-type amino acid transport substrate-binding protein